MRIWHISDTHTYHGLLEVPDNLDMVIFSGDCSNPMNHIINEPEVLNVLTWFATVEAKHKIMIAGNHDSSIESKLVSKKIIESYGIIYLENDDITIEGLKIWGSPITPTFGTWSFMKSRSKIHRIWDTIPDDTDIVVTHGPPKGILDLTYDFSNNIYRCGCNSLLKRMIAIQPKFNMFGHIHNNEDLINAGIQMLSSTESTVYSNGSVVTDGKFGKVSSNGNIFEI